MRLEYVSNPPNFTSESDKAIVSRVKERRGDRGLIPLDLTLLHSPPVADGWNAFIGSIRTRTTLNPSIRETAISRVAVLNRAWYEWEHHASLLPSSSITPAGLRYIFSSPAFRHPPSREHGLDEQHLAVLSYTDYMTLKIEVPDDVFERLKKAGFNEREIVEITATVGGYNCVSRFLVALNVNERNGVQGMRVAVEHTDRDGALTGAEPVERET